MKLSEIVKKIECWGNEIINVDHIFGNGGSKRTYDRKTKKNPENRIGVKKTYLFSRGINPVFKQ